MSYVIAFFRLHSITVFPIHAAILATYSADLPQAKNLRSSIWDKKMILRTAAFTVSKTLHTYTRNETYDTRDL